MTVHTTDVAIIGTGPSGLFMAFEAGFLGYSCILIDALPQAGGQLAALYPDKPIYDVPGIPKIAAGQLVANLMEQAATFNPTYLLNEQVTGLTGTAGDFTLTTASPTGGATVKAKVVVVAGGSGMFSPRKPTQLANLADFENTSVFYAVTHKEAFAGRTVVIAGGGDSAVDWVVELATIAEHVHVVHRRPDFKAAEAMVAAMQALVAAGKVTVHTPYQLHELTGKDGHINAVTIADLDGNQQVIPAERLVCCFGLLPNPGGLSDWGLNLTKGQIPVDHATQSTARPGVLCVGDMAHYDGKVALILTGFAEAAVAAKTIQAIINPEKKYRVQYSTSVLGKETT